MYWDVGLEKVLMSLLRESEGFNQHRPPKADSSDIRSSPKFHASTPCFEEWP